MPMRDLGLCQARSRTDEGDQGKRTRAHTDPTHAGPGNPGMHLGLIETELRRTCPVTSQPSQPIELQ